MSDSYYRQRAARRTRFWLLVGLVVVAVACVASGVVNVYRDTCTNSFDRAPQSVITSFIDAVRRGESEAVIRCWKHNAFYDLEAGCSEICLARILGTSYRVVELSLSEPFITDRGRANVVAAVSVVCPDGSRQHSGEIVLDSVGADLPWRHWKIVHSTFGGPLSAPWCQTERAPATPTTTPTETPTAHANPSEAAARPTARPASPASAATATPRPTLMLPTPTLTSTPPPPPETPAPPATATVPDVEIVVDNRDAGFSTTGAWFVGDGGQSYGDNCAWAPRGIQNIAYVRPELPLAGAYEVFAWWCGDPNHDQSQRARIEIYLTIGRVATYSVYVNLQENAGQWNSLGTYYLERNGMLSVDGYLDGNVVADAFRFVYRSPEWLIVTPTPMPTPIPWTNHPPSPLEQLTSGDLSSRLGLVQRFYPYTPLISTETLTFDDCQAFPRQDCGGSRDGWRVQVQYQDMVVAYRVSQDYRFVAIEPSGALAARQLLYLFGAQGDLFFRVDRYPDDTWHLSGADVGQTWASQLPLDAETVETLRALVQTYSTVTFETPDGIRLQLYGLGGRVALAQEDEGRLAALAADWAAAAW